MSERWTGPVTSEGMEVLRRLNELQERLAESYEEGLRRHYSWWGRMWVGFFDRLLTMIGH